MFSRRPFVISIKPESGALLPDQVKKSSAKIKTMRATHKVLSFVRAEMQDQRDQRQEKS